MGKFIDITGQKFGRLTVVSRAENNHRSDATWNCLCDCGNYCIVISSCLRNGGTKSCGCIQKEHAKARSKDITGQKFGRLTVVSRYGTKNKRATWNCICECGSKLISVGVDLRNGHTRSCGCLQKDTIIGNKYNYIPIEQRLDGLIDKSSGRWIWTGAVDKDGYGRINYNGKDWKAHRLIYTLYVGNIPEKMCICHLNDIPTDVTPDNLTCNSNEWNTQDKVNKNRQLKGESIATSKLKANDVIEIRNSSLRRKELAIKYNISTSSIDNIINRTRWKHIQ